MSAKLTPEICINNASSNSRLTAAGRQARATDTILRTVSRLFFFLFLPTLDEKTTELHLHAEKLTETVLHLNLGNLLGFFFVCVCVVLFYFMHPLWWDNYRTTFEAPSPGLETETETQIIKTETSLHLNLEVFWVFFFFLIFYFSFHFNSFLYIDISFIYLFFIFIHIFIFFFSFDFQSSLCLSNVCSAYCQLVQ
jgi:hypothetical protein